MGTTSMDIESSRMLCVYSVVLCLYNYFLVCIYILLSFYTASVTEQTVFSLYLVPYIRSSMFLFFCTCIYVKYIDAYIILYIFGLIPMCFITPHSILCENLRTRRAVFNLLRPAVTITRVMGFLSLLSQWNYWAYILIPFDFFMPNVIGADVIWPPVLSSTQTYGV